MQGGKKGRGPKASARGGAPPGDPNKDRLLYMLTCLTGHIVTVKLNNGQIWEGNFHACSSEGDISITLKTARQVPTGRGKSGEPVETMVISGKEFAQVSARNVPPMEHKSSASAFKTDAEIAEPWGDTQNRELVAWSAGGSQAHPAGVSMSLDSTRQIGTWNQFERNKEMFGITSTKIPEQKRKDAERIAREIESGQNYSRIEEGVADDVDEEAQFSAVGPHRDPIHAPLTMEPTRGCWGLEIRSASHPFEDDATRRLTAVELFLGGRMLGRVVFSMDPPIECVCKSGCEDRILFDVRIPEGATRIETAAFQNCRHLVRVAIHESVLEIGDVAFQNCSSLLAMNVPESVRRIGWGACKGCSSLTDLKLPKLTEMGHEAFAGCSSLTSLAIPESLTEIKTYAFYNCRSLRNLTLPESLTEIQAAAFSGCTSLRSLRIPNSVTKIGSEAFRGCRSLSSLVIPGSVTEIGYCAFEGCSGIERLTIPNSTKIGPRAFDGCRSAIKLQLQFSPAGCGFCCIFWLKWERL
eukprot:s259_g10.t1